jgi:hypothetical protein
MLNCFRLMITLRVSTQKPRRTIRLAGHPDLLMNVAVVKSVLARTFRRGDFDSLRLLNAKPQGKNIDFKYNIPPGVKPLDSH